MPVKFTQTYKTYEDAAAEARRAQALAEALQQQAYQPIQMTAAAPVSYTEGLAKVLQAYMAGRQQSKAAEAEKQAKKIGREEFQSYVESLSPEQKTMGVGDIAAMQMPTPSIEDGRITHQAAAPILNQKPVMQMTAEGAPDFSKPMMMQTGGPLTPGQRRAKLLEGLGSGNPMVQTVAQMEYNKPSMLGKIGDVQPDKFTPASLAQFQATGNAGVLVPSERESKAPAAVQEYEYAVRQGYTGSFQDFQNARASAGATKLNIDTKGSEVSQKLFLEELSNQHKTAKSSQGILDRLDRMKAATDAGTFTGATAPGAMAATQWLAGFGVNVAPGTLANSRTFEAARNQLVLDVMASSGGARGFTENETKILNDSFPKIVDDPKARQAISDVIRAKAKREVENYNSLLSDYTTTFKDSRIPYKPMQVETKEDRYQRYLRTRGAGPQAVGGVPQ